MGKENNAKARKVFSPKLLFVGAAVVLIVIFIIIISLFGVKNEKADFNVFFSFNGTLTEDAKERFSSALYQIVGDINGDGKILINIEYQKFDPSEYSEDELNMLALRFNQDDYCLYFLSDQPDPSVGFKGLSTTYCDADFFDDMSNYGFTPDVKYNSRVQVNQSSLFREMGLGDIDFFASIIDWSSEDAGKSTEVDTAAHIIEQILSD